MAQPAPTAKTLNRRARRLAAGITRVAPATVAAAAAQAAPLAAVEAKAIAKAVANATGRAKTVKRAPLQYLKPAGNMWADVEQVSVNNALAFLQGLLNPSGQGQTYYPSAGEGTVCAQTTHVVRPTAYVDGGTRLQAVVVKPQLYNQLRRVSAWTDPDTITWDTPEDDPEADPILDNAFLYRVVGQEVQITFYGTAQDTGSRLYVGQFPYQGNLQANAPTGGEDFTPATSLALFASASTTQEFSVMELKSGVDLAYVPTTFDTEQMDVAASVGAAIPTFLAPQPTMFGWKSIETGTTTVPMEAEGYMYFILAGTDQNTDNMELKIITRYNFIPNWVDASIFAPQVSLGSLSDIEKAFSACVMFNKYDPLNECVFWRKDALRILTELAKTAQGGGSFWSRLGKGLRKAGNFVAGELSAVGKSALQQVLKRGAAEAAAFGGLAVAERRHMQMAHRMALSLKRPDLSPASNTEAGAAARATLKAGGDACMAIMLRAKSDALEEEKKDDPAPEKESGDSAFPSAQERAKREAYNARATIDSRVADLRTARDRASLQMAVNRLQDQLNATRADDTDSVVLCGDSGGKPSPRRATLY